MSAEEPEITEGDRLRARGVDLELMGVTRRLLFSYEAILELEREYETLEVYLTKLQARRQTEVVNGITACLLHEFEDVATPSEIAGLRKHVLRHLSTKRFTENFTALWHAIAEGLPEVKAERPKGPTVPSTGAATSSRRGVSAIRRQSSGGRRRRK